MRQTCCLIVASLVAVAPTLGQPPKVDPPVAGRPKVERSQVHGQWRFPGETLVRINGMVSVIDAHTLRYEDGTEVDLNGGMDAPDLAQKGRIGGKLYRAGEQAAEFLRKLVADKPVTSYVGDKVDDRAKQKKFVQVDAFLGETCLNHEMIRNGWAMAHHTGTAPWEAIAREHKRGIWRGELVLPEKWHKGERLPGEEAARKPANEQKPSDKPPAIVGAWKVTSYHTTQASLFQLTWGARRRESNVRFEQAGDRLTGYAMSTDHDHKSEPIVFRTLQFSGDRLVFEFDIKGWALGVGPLAVESARLPNKGTLRVEARLTGDRLVGAWKIFTTDGSEVFRGEWEAVRAKEVQKK